MKTKKTLKINFYDINDVQPPNRKWCLCIVKDLDSGELLVRTGYYDDGSLWDTAGSKASGYGDVLYWIPTDEIETQFQPTTSQAGEVDLS